MMLPVKYLMPTFNLQEDTAGYIRMLREITSSHGIPLALYHDQHSIFEVSEDQIPSLEEQISWEKPQTQLGRILEELGINSISAKSPQAKGRVERLWETFQDRLVSELRLAGASSISEANQVLAQFLPDYNRSFRFRLKSPVRPIASPNPILKKMKSFVINIVGWWELIMWLDSANRDSKFCPHPKDRAMPVARWKYSSGWIIVWQFIMKDNSLKPDRLLWRLRY